VLLYDFIADMKKFVQAIRFWFLKPQNKEPTRLFKVRNPIDTRNGEFKSVGVSHVVEWFRKMAPYGLIPDNLTACSIAITKSPFCSVVKPMGLERLMCNGKAAPRSLVRNVWIIGPARPGGVLDFKVEISLFNGSYSTVEGYPRLSQQHSEFIHVW